MLFRLFDFREISVKTICCIAVGPMRRVWSFKSSQIGRFAMGRDEGRPLLKSTVPSNALKSGRIRTLHAGVPVVLWLRSLAQVVEPVIRSRVIAVIYLVYRPFSSHVQPNYSVRVIPAVVYAKLDIPVRYRPPSLLADELRIPCSSSVFTVAPAQVSSLAIVTEDRAHELSSEIVARLYRTWFRLVSHCELQSRWLGPGSSASNALPSRYFYATFAAPSTLCEAPCC